MVKNRISGLNHPIKWAGSVLNKVIANRRTHDDESDRIYGTPARGYPAYPNVQFYPFYWWIPDNEYLRKISDFECHELPETCPYIDPTGHFTWVHGKYGANTETKLTNPQLRTRNRAIDEGPIYHLAGRLERLTKEFIGRIGL